MAVKFISWEEAVLWLQRQSDQASLVRDCYYDDPLETAALRYYRSGEWRGVQFLLSSQKPGTALDIGAGRGITSFALAQDGWQVTALEPDPSPIVGASAIRNLATGAALDITVVEEHGESLPFADESFQMVFMRQALHHAGDLGTFCGEAARVLKRGGIFLAVREHVISRRSDLPIFLAIHPLHHLYGGEHAYLLEDYRAALAAAGIKVTGTLAPYDTEINLYPDSLINVKQRLERRMHLRLPNILFHRVMVPLLNARNDSPGRLYSFVGVKKWN